MWPDAAPPEPVRSCEVRPCDTEESEPMPPPEKGPDPKETPKKPLPLPLEFTWRGWTVRLRIWPPGIRVLRYF